MDGVITRPLVVQDRQVDGVITRPLVVKLFTHLDLCEKGAKFSLRRHMCRPKNVYTSLFVRKGTTLLDLCGGAQKILITVAQIASISMTHIGFTGAVEMMVSWKFTLNQRSGILANCNEFTST